MIRPLPLISLTLLVVSCGNAPTPPSEATAPGPEVVTVLGESPVSQRIELPAAQTLAVSPTTLQAASLPGSAAAAHAVPRWTGPVHLSYSMYDAGRGAVGPQGELTVTAADDTTARFEVARYAANGQPLAQHGYSLPAPSNIPAGSGPAHPYPQTWVVSTEDAPDQELYVMNIYGSGPGNTPDPARGPVQAEFRLLNAALHPRMTNVDGPYHLPLLVSANSEVRPGQRGIVVATPRPWNFSGSQRAPRGTRIYELSHQAWDNVETDQLNVLLPPSQYADHYTSSQMDTAPDGSVYVATFTSYQQDCVRACPSVAGVTRLRGGQVEWQKFWDADEPVQLSDVAASEAGVGLLLTRSQAGANEGSESPAQSNVLLTFSADGTPLQNLNIPGETANVAFPLAYQQLQLKADGRFVLGAAQVLAAGNLKQGITRKQVLGGIYTQLEVQHLLGRGEYLYVQGKAAPGELAQVQPPVPLPTRPKAASYQSEQFVLPYDFDLNPRW
ncbi:MAG: hypothetical protein Q4C67_07080 [Deinococcus sp.]|nr:hypothetical protein [Deinococcus sp.]